MSENNKKNNSKKITFSEEVDSTISGFALVITFIGVGIFLMFNRNYFNNTIVSTVIQWIFIIVGILGFATEISNINTNKGIKGIDNLILGAVMIFIWSMLYLWIKNIIGNIIGFLILIFGGYGTCRGLLEITYSIFKTKKDKTSNEISKMSIIKDCVLIFSEITGIGLIVVQILQAVNVI